MVPFWRNAPRTHSSTSRLVSPALCTGQCVTRGRSFASSGKSHSCETPTTWSIKPSAAAISVAAGKSETMRITSYCMRFLGAKTENELEEGLKKETGRVIEFRVSRIVSGRDAYKPPTACEISRTTMVSEIKIWTIVKTFAQRASNGASVGPKVELCVKATNR